MTPAQGKHQPSPREHIIGLVQDRPQFDRQKSGFTANADPRVPGYSKDERRRRRDPKFSSALRTSKRRGSR